MNIPIVTYRLQFNADFNFDAADKIIPYLAELGISHIYASPIFKARTGSQHGYDVVDHNLFNPELGTNEAFERLVNRAQEHHLHWLQDIVPNHRAYSSENKILMDVLENGKNSKYHQFFDIQWEGANESLHNRVLVPFLGDYFGRVLEKGELKIVYEESVLMIQYYQLKIPIAIESYARVFQKAVESLKASVGEDDPDFIKIQGVIDLAQKQDENESDTERESRIKFVKNIVKELTEKSVSMKRYMEKCLELMNGTPDNPESFDDLEELLNEQRYRLSFWKVAAEELNYRRFFSINELICLKVEEEMVFEKTHDLVIKLVHQGKINGLRVDHIDGLYDPKQYLERLRQRLPEVYIVVEKILESDEVLPRWPVQGTTGYDFMYYLNGLFCQKSNERYFDRIYSRFLSYLPALKKMTLATKRLMIGKEMGGDVDNLAQLTKTVFGHHRHTSDMTLFGLRRAIVELMAQFTVYRTYQTETNHRESDLDYIEEAVNAALKSQPGLKNELEYISKFLKLDFEENIDADDRIRWIHFVKRFQQFTGPLMAKGVEDTLFYRYNRLISQNEVGGAPGDFGIEKEAFLAFLTKRSTAWPFTMNATATHDTKRGEDMRAKLNVLSEIPQEWIKQLRIWRKMNVRKKMKIGGERVPDSNDEYFLYQTLLGAFPLEAKEQASFQPRIKEYLIKAVREAKVHTAWLKPDEDYENAFLKFIDKLLVPNEGNLFWPSFLEFHQRIVASGMYTSMSQVICKLMAPGIPDIYQGTEFWDFSLVDPDNRRSVDYKKRGETLLDMKEKEKIDQQQLVKELMQNKSDGRIKQYLLYKGLGVRNQFTEIFQNGTVQVLQGNGVRSENLVAFMWLFDQKTIIVILSRFFSQLLEDGQEPFGMDIWKDTTIVIPEEVIGTWQDALTGNSIDCEAEMAVGKVLVQLPCAVLIKNQGS